MQVSPSSQTPAPQRAYRNQCHGVNRQGTLLPVTDLMHSWPPLADWQDLLVLFCQWHLLLLLRLTGSIGVLGLGSPSDRCICFLSGLAPAWIVLQSLFRGARADICPARINMDNSPVSIGSAKITGDSGHCGAGASRQSSWSSKPRRVTCLGLVNRGTVVTSSRRDEKKGESSSPYSVYFAGSSGSSHTAP